jgi:hypothetical protein
MMKEVIADMSSISGSLLPPPAAWSAPPCRSPKTENHATAIQPTVPQTRMFPNFRRSTGEWWKVMAFKSGDMGLTTIW